MTPQQTIDEYCQLHGLAPFKLSEFYDLQRDCKQQYPNCGSPGCYLFYNATNELLYIGKTSLRNTLGSRISAHICWNSERSLLVPKEPESWSKYGYGLPRYVQTVATRHPYEAPSLEEYLIDKLQPLLNVRGLKECRDRVDA
jgi:excinuclease UvrABC nuclease subunit